MEQYLKNFLRNAVGRMEGAVNAPYEPGFAGGHSGVSFGRMQNDVAANRDARSVFRGILDNSKDATGLTDFDITRLMWRAMTPGVTREDLNQEVPDGVEKVKKALGANQAAVDARDSARLDEIVNDVDRARDAVAQTRNDPLLTFDPYLMTDVGDWDNRTGGLKQTTDFLNHAAGVTRGVYDGGYLEHQPQFNKGTEKFTDWKTRVDNATRNAMADTFPFLQPESGNLLNADAYGQNLLNAEQGLNNAGYEIPPPGV